MGCCTSKNTKNLAVRPVQLSQSAFNLRLKLQGSDFIRYNTFDIKQIYKLGSRVGVGSFGEVRRCYHKLTGDLRAVKVYQKEMIHSLSDGGAQFYQELRIMRLLDHPNIIKIFEIFEDETEYYIVMEYCQGGELYEKIKQHTTFTERDCADIFRQLICVISFLHSKRIAHRDVKPENVMLEERASEISLRLCDFGEATHLNQEGQCEGYCGTSYYLPPEIAKKQVYTEKCDIWSSAVLLYMLLLGEPPFKGKDDDQIIENIINGHIGKEIQNLEELSDEVKDLLGKMLCPEETRISAYDVLQHPWMQQKMKKTVNDQAVAQALQNMTNYQSQISLRHSLKLFITSQLLQQKDIKVLKEVFIELDKDQDGMLTEQDLYLHLSSKLETDTSRELSKQIIQNVVKSRESIGYTEFLCAAIDPEVLLSKRNIDMTFKLLDVNDDKVISVQEMRDMLATDQEGDQNA